VTVLIALLAFMFGSLIVTAAALALAPDAAGAMERRLGEVTGTTIKRPSRTSATTRRS